MRGGFVGSPIGSARPPIQTQTEGAGFSQGLATVLGVGTSLPGPRLEITDTDILQKPVNVMMAETQFQLGNPARLSKGLFKSIFNE